MKAWMLDVIGLAGCVAVVHGVGLAYVPAAWMVGGVAAVTVALLGAKRYGNPD